MNISSIGGRIALPLAGPYAASKFALEAVSDSLRRELHGQGIHVALVEPGGVKTPIWEKGVSTGNAIVHAVTSPRPRTRYMLGRDAKLRWAIAKRVPDRWFDALIARALR